MGYLIPKSARNVRLQLFKGLGLPEAGIIAAAVVLALLIFNTAWGMVVRVAIKVVGDVIHTRHFWAYSIISA